MKKELIEFAKKEILKNARQMFYKKLKSPQFEVYKKSKYARTKLWKACFEQSINENKLNQKWLKQRKKRGFWYERKIWRNIWLYKNGRINNNCNNICNSFYYYNWQANICFYSWIVTNSLAISCLVVVAMNNLNKISKPMGFAHGTATERESTDFYATDPAAIDLLLTQEQPNKNIWECACGLGHLSKRLLEFGYKGDIMKKFNTTKALVIFLNILIIITYIAGAIEHSPYYLALAIFIQLQLNNVYKNEKENKGE